MTYSPLCINLHLEWNVVILYIIVGPNNRCRAICNLALTGRPVYSTHHLRFVIAMTCRPRCVWACFLDCIVEIVLLRCVFKKRWMLLSLIPRPDEGRWLTGRNVSVFVFCFIFIENFCRLSLFLKRRWFGVRPLVQLMVFTEIWSS